MSRKTLLIFTLITTLALLSISAVAADGDALTLKTSDYIEGKGLVLKFDGAENLDPLPLDGQITIGDKQYAMTCSLDDDGVLTCVAFVPKSHFGDSGTVQLGDYSFDVIVREPRPEPEPKVVPPSPPPSPCTCVFAPIS